MAKFSKKNDFDYFEYFCTCAISACEAADFLHKVLSSFNHDNFPDQMSELHKIENEADKRRHEMIEILSHEFMTPIEREDIISLAQELDNVVDTIDDIMRRIYMFDIKNIRPETMVFTDLIIKICHALKDVMNEFKYFKSSKVIRLKIVVVNSLESEGDTLHAESLHRLFRDESDTREIIVWMTMFEDLENCLDSCEDAVDIIESVIMKNT